MTEMTPSEEEESTFETPFKIGEKVQDFELPDMEGKIFRISDYKGKVILLFFFATWCPYCSAEAPFLEKEIWQKLKDRGVQVITVDVKESKELLDKFIKRFNWSMPVLLDTDGAVAEKLGPRIEGVAPDMSIVNGHIIIDREQRVRSYDFLNVMKFDAHASRVVRLLEQLLRE